MSAQSSFLSNTFASELIEVKRSLDQFMQMQIDSVKECKLSRKSKCGILPYVSNIEEFAINADCLLKSDRRADLEKWYTRLVDTILEYITIHSNDHHKTPPQVIKMGKKKIFGLTVVLLMGSLQKIIIIYIRFCPN
jgi:hypothetical protein